MINTIPRPLAKSGPTEDILRQCGHRARALFNVLNWKEITISAKMYFSKQSNLTVSLPQITKNVSWQWAHPTLHMPGIDNTGGVMGLGARLMIRLQLGLGQAMRCEELLHISKQLHGHRTYFFPGGAFRIGCMRKIVDVNLVPCISIDKTKNMYKHTVASLHWQHLTTCWSLLPEISIIAWQTLQVTIGMPPWVADWYGGGSSSGPIVDTVLTVDWDSSANEQRQLISFQQRKRRIVT